MPRSASVRRLIDSRVGQLAKPLIGDALARAGFQLVAFDRGERQRLAALLKAEKIECVLDVGANQGQYGSMLRGIGYMGHIHSFEPQSAAFPHLLARARRDGNWTATNVALSAAPGTGHLNISANSTSSSLLDIQLAHTEVAPESKVVAKEEVTVTTLDEAVGASRRDGPFFLKVDVQGAELEVLQGASEVLCATRLLQVEASLQSLYEGAPKLSTLLEWLETNEFVPVAVGSAFEDTSTGHTLQIDIMSARLSRLAKHAGE